MQLAQAEATGVHLDGWVFTDGDGQPSTHHGFTPAFERIARCAGLPVIRLHELRHTGDTLLIKAGVPVKPAAPSVSVCTPQPDAFGR